MTGMLRYGWGWAVQRSVVRYGASQCNAVLCCEVQYGAGVWCRAHRLAIGWCQMRAGGVGGAGGPGAISVPGGRLGRPSGGGGGGGGAGGTGAFRGGSTAPFLACRPPGAGTDRGRYRHTDTPPDRDTGRPGTARRPAGQETAVRLGQAVIRRPRHSNTARGGCARQEEILQPSLRRICREHSAEPRL